MLWSGSSWRRWLRASQAPLDVPVETTGEGVGKADAAAGGAVVAVVIAQIRGEAAPRH